MKRASYAVFLGFFGLYLWSMSPTLAAYRDTGEMALSAHTLGVSHPPSYPLYILLGRLFDQFPWGSDAYALALLSALAGAGALTVLFRLLARNFGLWAGAGAVVLLGTNVTFWTVSIVQEMYSLTLLCAALLLTLGLRLREEYRARVWYASAFLFGLFLGNRTDLLLWGPGLVVLGFPRDFGRWRSGGRIRFLARTAVLGLLGLTVYLYLPFRSIAGPWLDWNHPGNFHNFIGSLTRRGYGGTLDLLSKNYAMGAMFLPNLKVYGAHLWHNFSLIGLGLIAVGIFREFRSKSDRLPGMALLYVLSGPVFFFLANLPPNPHAMAIVEPHYLLSNIVLAFWAAAGVASLSSYGPPALVVCVSALMLQPWLLGRHREMNRRWDTFDYDYVGNVLRSTPPGSILVAKKDVQLFSLWYYTRVRKKRPDIHLVAQGLSHSPWYQESHYRFRSPLRLRELKTEEGWRSLHRDNSPAVFATMDVELPKGIDYGAPHGMVLSVFPPREGPLPKTSPHVWDFFVRRGDYRYERRPDFFTSDLIGDYVSAGRRRAGLLVKESSYGAAREAFLSAWAMKWRVPEIATYLGYISHRGDRQREALESYKLADELFQRTLDLADEYHTLDDVRSGILRSRADNLVNLGVLYEKIGDKAEAERTYRRALASDPAKAQAHFNLSVLYWKKDWEKVVFELEAALSADPNHADSKKFLPVARAHLQRARP